MPEHTAEGNGERSHVATVEEYISYLTAHPLKAHQIRMLQANALGMCTAIELAEAAGWSDYSAANLHYGTLGKNIGRYLGLTFRRYEKHDKEFFISAIAQEHRVQGPKGETWAFELHPEFLAALTRLGAI